MTNIMKFTALFVGSVIGGALALGAGMIAGVIQNDTPEPAPAPPIDCKAQIEDSNTCDLTIEGKQYVLDFEIMEFVEV